MLMLSTVSEPVMLVAPVIGSVKTADMVGWAPLRSALCAR
jgi:hypothetical protein